MVAKLGDASFLVRDEALRNLRPKAWEIRETIVRGLTNPDPELRWRFRELWDEIRAQYLQEFTAAKNVGMPSGLPAWDRFRENLGDTPDSRRLYADMILAEEDVIISIALQTHGAGRMAHSPGSNWLQVYAGARGRELVKTNSATAATAFALQFAAIAGEGKSATEAAGNLSDLVLSGAVQEAIQKSEASRKLFGIWMKNIPSAQGLSFSMRMGLPKAKTIATDLITNAEAPAYDRQNSILYLARNGKPGDARLLAPLLEDRSFIDTFLSKGRAVKLQLRDVALAASIHLAGQDPVNFGFDDRKPDPDTLYRPGSLAFADEEKRTAAFERWKKFVAENSPFPAAEPAPSPTPATVPEAAFSPPPREEVPHVIQDWPEPGVVLGSEDELTRRDGIKFGGRLLSHAEPGRILAWGKHGKSDARNISFANVLRIRLAGNAPANIGDPKPLVTLTNGDVIAGNLVGMNDETLTLATDYAGQMSVKRSLVSSIAPNPATDAAYIGPQDGSEWASSSPAAGWKYKDGALVSTGPGSVSRTLSWSGVPMGIEFSLDWKSPAQLQMQIGDGGQTSLGLRVSNGKAVIQGTVTLKLRNPQPAAREKLLDTKILRTPDAGATVFLSIDPLERMVSLFVNGIEIQKAAYSGNLPPGRCRIVLASETLGMTLRNLKISKRFPSIEKFPVPRSAPPRLTSDFIALANFDASQGKVSRLADGKISFRAADTDFNLPLSRIAKIHFARKDTGRSRREEGDVFAFLNDGSRITLQLETIEDSAITGRSENLGRIRIARNAVRELQFNVHDEIRGICAD